MRNKRTIDISEADVFFATHGPGLDQIIDGSKNYEFRRYSASPEVKRIWYYRCHPVMAVTHVCEVRPPCRQGPEEMPLQEEGVGNDEFNTKYDPKVPMFAYKILTVYALKDPITRIELEMWYGIVKVPQSFVYVPLQMTKDVVWHKQNLVRTNP